jgi:hypothetical protein
MARARTIRMILYQHRSKKRDHEKDEKTHENRRGTLDEKHIIFDSETNNTMGGPMHTHGDEDKSERLEPELDMGNNHLATNEGKLALADNKEAEEESNTGSRTESRGRSCRQCSNDPNRCQGDYSSSYSTANRSLHFGAAI